MQLRPLSFEAALEASHRKERRTANKKSLPPLADIARDERRALPWYHPS